jgi:Rha family phage regulatory protein
LVAQKFNKRHTHVLESIKKLIDSAEKLAQLFASSSYVDESGKSNPMYIMNRDGFSLLVMGFTGKDALNFKLEFIEAFNLMEKKLKEAPEPLSTLDLLELTIKGMRENNQELQEVKKEVLELKAKTQTRPDYFTIVGYGTLHGIHVGLPLASRLGRIATGLCKARGIETDKIPDPRFGEVKMYPTAVLDEVFEQSLTTKGGAL